MARTGVERDGAAADPQDRITPNGPQDRDTRTRLIDAAERLFAARGIEAVSINQILKAAGQRNASAVHYHVGSKFDLIKAILGRRMAGINERRLELLAAADPADRPAAVRALARALVLPFAEQLEPAAGEGGRNYVCFVGQVHGDPRVDMFRLVRGQHDSSIREVIRIALATLPDLPETVVRRRLAFATTLFIHALAERARGLNHAGTPPGAADSRRLTESLVDAVAAMLDGPVGPEVATLTGRRN